jgi:bacteriocin-like protein
MTALQQQKTEIETQELSETELSQVTGGIIAVLRPATQLCDGSVRPVSAQAEKGIIAI